MPQFDERRAFSAKISTVLCHDDNALLRQMIEQPSQGEVLVADGGGSLGSALLGDIVAEIAPRNGWSGIVILGAVRDAAALNGRDIGVKVLGTNPKKSAKKGSEFVDAPVTFGGVPFTPGYWLYRDDDGIRVPHQAPLETRA